MSVSLPERRPAITERLIFRGNTYFLGLGPHPETGRVLEIFLKGPQAGSDLEGMTSRACILASLLMQKADLTVRQVLDLVDLNTDPLTGTEEPDLLLAMLRRAASFDDELRGKSATEETGG